MKLILASASTRRAQILKDAGLPFEMIQADTKESRKRDESARVMTRRLAQAKAEKVAKKIGKTGYPAIVIGADTTVEVNGELLGKPHSAAAARKMLLKLAGRTHRVITSVAAIRLPDCAEKILTETTRVRFTPLTAREISEYIATGEPLDKAGAYGVQGIGGRYIERLEGCYFNVVGLPLARLYRMLRSLGWQPAATDQRGNTAG